MRSAIVTCCSADWLPAAATALLSARVSDPGMAVEYLVCVHKPAPDDLANLKLFNARHGIEITPIDADLAGLSRTAEGPYGPVGFIRLKLDQYVPPHYDRVLYLDADVLATGPVDELLQAELNGCPVGAVEDVGMMDWVDRAAAAHRKRIGFPPAQPYFNSGVMLFDWKKMLAMKILPKALQVFQSAPNLGFPDQDALNLVLRDRWAKLDFKWNILNLTDDYIQANARIRHFTDPRKPWTVNCRAADRRWRAYYADSLRGTPWQAFPDPRGYRWSPKAEIMLLGRKLRLLKRARLAKLVRTPVRRG